MKEIPKNLRIPGEVLIPALRKQPNLEKVTLSGLANTLKDEYGIRDAYRKVQELPRKSPCRLDSDLIIQNYGPEAPAMTGRTSATSNPTDTPHQTEVTSANTHEVISATEAPEIVDRKFVKTVSYKEAELLLSGKNKLNLWVDGDSGLGKTSCILNILRQQNREAIRFNCSYHQDVDDLIGGHRLIGGDTVYFDGAVVVAQERGATLLLDEVDAADPKLLFEIQSVLEGNGVLLKKIGRMSYPKPGFQVIATGNTKGRGDLTGDFAGTNVQNKSFLDRFDAAMTWKAPVEDEMTKILKANSSLTEDVISLMAKWYYQILQGAEASVVPVIVSPRRMLSIGKILENFGVTDPMDDKLKKAVGFSVNNFDEEVRDAFIGMLDLQLDEYKTSKIPQATADDIVNGELSGDEPF